MSTRLSPTENTSHLMSMTGFGRSTLCHDSIEYTAEVRSVNHRYIEINCKLPVELYGEENDLREIIRGTLHRGKIDLFLRTQESSEQATSVNLECNFPLFKELLSLYKKAQKIAGLRSKAPSQELIARLFTHPEVLAINESGKGKLTLPKEKLLALVHEACKKLAEMRNAEGARIGTDVLTRVSILAQLREEIARELPSITQKLQAKLQARIQELAPQLSVSASDPRIAMEIVLQTDRADLTEELVRLQSHLTEFSLAISQAHQGRRLEFILQEITREFSTIGAKLQDATLQKQVINAKVELEKIREQLQNIA